MSYQDLILEHRGAVAWLYINRPTTMNALALQTMRELKSVFEELGAREQTRVVVVSGKGKAFCAGADLRSEGPQSDSTARVDTFLAAGVEMERALAAIGKPVIAAVNGICCAGGLEVALMCDFIIAAESAKVGDAHANFGAMPGGGATARLPRVLGPALTKYLMFTGDLAPARDLAWTGLFSRVCADEQLDAVTQEIADKVASRSPLGLATMKRLVDAALDRPLDAAIDAEKAAAAQYLRSYDAAEGAQAFAQRRAPQFQGR